MIVKWRKDDNYAIDEGIYAELLGITLTIWRVNGGWRAWANSSDLGTMPTRRQAKLKALKKASAKIRATLRAADDEIARIEASR